MKFYLFLVLGILSITNIIYRIATCPSCDTNFLSFPISGYMDLAIQSVFTVVFLNAANKEYKKNKVLK